jgi:hypothetical protein
MRESGDAIHMFGCEIPRNEGRADRAVRIVIGLVLLAIAGFSSGGARVVLLLLAAVPLITGLIGFCPLYAPFGLCTKRSREKEGATP